MKGKYDFAFKQLKLLQDKEYQRRKVRKMRVDNSYVVLINDSAHYPTAIWQTIEKRKQGAKWMLMIYGTPQGQIIRFYQIGFDGAARCRLVGTNEQLRTEFPAVTKLTDERVHDLVHASNVSGRPPTDK